MHCSQPELQNTGLQGQVVLGKAALSSNVSLGMHVSVEGQIRSTQLKHV